MSSSLFYSPVIERALRVAAAAHESQYRKATNVPYVTHPVHVAWSLLRAGLSEETLIAAALLHDCVEDTPLTLADLREQFSPAVADIVAEVSERKHDAEGRPRAWEDRKREHLETIGSASFAARAVTLADKLHNLATIRDDLNESPDVWGRFNAPPERLLWYYREMITRASADDPRLEPLARAGLDLLNDLDSRLAAPR